MGEGRELCPGLVWAMTVVVLGVGVEDLSGMGFVPYEQVVEDLAPQGSDDPLAWRVHPGRSRRCRHDLDVIGREDCVEGLGVLRVPVANQEAQRVHPRTQLDGEVSRLLHRPGSGGMACHAGNVQSACLVLEEHQRVHAAQADQVDV